VQRQSYLVDLAAVDQLMNRMIRDASMEIVDPKLFAPFWKSIHARTRPVIEQAMLSLMTQQKKYPCPNFAGAPIARSKLSAHLVGSASGLSLLKLIQLANAALAMLGRPAWTRDILATPDGQRMADPFHFVPDPFHFVPQ